jgi:hypothetical protein
MDKCSGDMKNKSQLTVDLKGGLDQWSRRVLEIQLAQRLSGRGRVGGKPSWFFARRVAPLEVYRKGVLYDQNHLFQPLMSNSSGKTLIVDLEMTRINGRGEIR